MNDVNSAARSFFVLAEASRLMSLAHERNCKWDYEIKAIMTDGSPNPQTVTDLPKPTGGYEIHIIIYPPLPPESIASPAVLVPSPPEDLRTATATSEVPEFMTGKVVNDWKQWKSAPQFQSAEKLEETRRQAREVRPGMIRRVPAEDASPGIREKDGRTIIDAAKVAVLFDGQEILLADILQRLPPTA